jgi:hypothetical protein
MASALSPGKKKPPTVMLDWFTETGFGYLLGAAVVTLLGRLHPPLIRTNSTLDHVEIGL